MTALILQINKEILEQKCAVGSKNKFLTFKPQLCYKVILPSQRCPKNYCF